MAYAVADPFRQAVRSGLAINYVVDAYLGGNPVAGAQGLQPTGGNITDTTKAGVRRVLNLDLAPDPGLFDKLSPIGTQLKVRAVVRYTDRTTASIPMGVFVVDSEKISEGGGGLSLTAPDKWELLRRYRFVGPTPSISGWLVTDQIIALIQSALGMSEPVVVTATSKATMSALVWEKDRDKAIIDLATSIGAWVYFDRNGVATVADIPTASGSADWLVDASAGGVLTSLDRERSRTNTYNVVIVSSSNSAGESFPSQMVWDDNPSSPTYAGTNPLTAPQTAGPFGIATYYFDTPLPLTVAGARDAGLAILARVSGLASQVSLGQVPNPAVDAMDALDVLGPRERYDIPRALERHIADTVAHPLTVGGEQTIDGRSTRSEEIVGGS